MPRRAPSIRVDPAAIRQRQAQLGLSNVDVARSLPVSEKTWYRWMQRGEVALLYVPALERTLEMRLQDGDGVDEKPSEVEVFFSALARGEGRLDAETDAFLRRLAAATRSEGQAKTRIADELDALRARYREQPESGLRP